MRVEVWLNLYETYTDELDDRSRIKNMMFTLTCTALNWFGTEIATNSKLTWAEVREKMVQMFGSSKTVQLFEAQRMYLRRDQKVSDYFKEKVTNSRLTSLSEAEIVDQLTASLPHYWQQTITVMPIKDILARDGLSTRDDYGEKAQQQTKAPETTSACA